jgi:hypothetical protein
MLGVVPNFCFTQRNVELNKVPEFLERPVVITSSNPGRKRWYAKPRKGK